MTGNKCYKLIAGEGAKSKQNPSNEALAPTLDGTRVRVLADLNLGELFDDLQGHQLAILNFFVNEGIYFQRNEDGTWQEAPGVFSIEEEVEPFEDCPSDYFVPAIAEATLVETQALRTEKEQNQLLFEVGQPEWIQGDDSPREEGYRFIARVSTYNAEDMFVFYNPELRKSYHVCQFS